MRIMCDTNVLVRTILSPNGAAAELLRIIAKEHSLVVSLPVLGELYDVLRRPQIRVLHRLPDEQIRRAISRLYKLGIVVALPSALPLAVPHDPKDDPIVMTAIAGKADVLCTLDQHLHDAAVTALCAGNGIRILRDAELLAELRTS
jgi:putative PIN family toxin of toxin-antitoxin system